MGRVACWPWLALAVALCCGACDPGTRTEVVFVERSGCLACHRPLTPDGTAVGIEEAHVPVDGRELTCVDCHGGDPEARKQSEAHVLPPPGAGEFIKGLTHRELDDVEQAYLRFINPGDLRVAPMSCGGGSAAAGGTACHQEIIDRVEASAMATSAGLFGVPRYRAGLQRRGAGVKGVRDVRDASFRAGEDPAAVASLDALAEPRVGADEDSAGPYMDLYMAKECGTCHLWSFGDNRAPGLYRSSGCSACHMVYANDGLSQSEDPTVDRQAPPHPVRHALVTAPPTEQCVHCHHRGGRVGLSYQGIRERGADGTDPTIGVPLGEALFGHPAGHYLVDEDGTDDVDQTPPDIHFEAGLHCVDCHTEADVHGNGRIYTHAPNAVEVRCQDCHGDIDQEATGFTREGTPLTHLSQDDAGRWWLTSKVTGRQHPVTQIKRSVEAAPPDSPLRRAMGRGEGGFSHVDRLDCASCHSAWVPTCYGCHVSVDMASVQANQLDGRSSPGAFTTTPGRVRTDVLLLMLDTEGLISPSMPAARLFFSATDGAGAPLFERQVRRGPGEVPGMGHRAFSPHTTRRVSPFQACTTCHLNAAGDNLEEVRRVAGFGSQEFIEVDGDDVPWLLDQLIDDEFAPQVLVGHDAPFESRPLTREIIDRMLDASIE